MEGEKFSEAFEEIYLTLYSTPKEEIVQEISLNFMQYFFKFTVARFFRHWRVIWIQMIQMHTLD
jgi:hypothetical protein